MKYVRYNHKLSKNVKIFKFKANSAMLFEINPYGLLIWTHIWWLAIFANLKRVTIFENFPSL